MAKTDTAAPTLPSLEELQHWTWVMGRAQQMLLEQGIGAIAPAESSGLPVIPGFNDAATIERAQSFWTDSLDLWQRFLDPVHAPPVEERPEQARDKRFKDAAWRDNPMFDWIRQSYFLISDHLLQSVDAVQGVDAKQKEQLRFAARGFLDAMSPSNFPATNPQVLEKTIETGGENLLKGLQ
ncbi:MAG: class I poly(R)-hydroxyalkanoic acid synthase, partial [Pseudomonadota bacterium]